jgi:hypothetical protein
MNWACPANEVESIIQLQLILDNLELLSLSLNGTISVFSFKLRLFQYKLKRNVRKSLESVWVLFDIMFWEWKKYVKLCCILKQFCYNRFIVFTQKYKTKMSIGSFHQDNS